MFYARKNSVSQLRGKRLSHTLREKSRLIRQFLAMRVARAMARLGDDGT